MVDGEHHDRTAGGGDGVIVELHERVLER